MYSPLTPVEATTKVKDAKTTLSGIVKQFKNLLTQQEIRFLKLYADTPPKIPHFYILWKMHKNPVVGRPIVAGYNWITTGASKLVAYYLNQFVTHFELPDSFSLVRELEKTHSLLTAFYLQQTSGHFTLTSLLMKLLKSTN